MPATPTVDAIGVVVTDMARSLSFYRRLGCDFPEGAESEGHVTAELGGGVRLMLDTVQSLEEMSFDIGDEEPGHGWMTLAVRCGCPGEVDSLYAELAAQGSGTSRAFRRGLGAALRLRTRPGRQPCRPLCPGGGRSRGGLEQSRPRRCRLVTLGLCVACGAAGRRTRPHPPPSRAPPQPRQLNSKPG